MGCINAFVHGISTSAFNMQGLVHFLLLFCLAEAIFERHFEITTKSSDLHLRNLIMNCARMCAFTQCTSFVLDENNECIVSPNSKEVDESSGGAIRFIPYQESSTELQNSVVKTKDMTTPIGLSPTTTKLMESSTTKPSSTSTTVKPSTTKPSTTSTTAEPSTTKPSTTSTTAEPSTTKPSTTSTTAEPSTIKPSTTSTTTALTTPTIIRPNDNVTVDNIQASMYCVGAPVELNWPAEDRCREAAFQSQCDKFVAEFHFAHNYPVTSMHVQIQFCPGESKFFGENCVVAFKKPTGNMDYHAASKECTDSGGKLLETLDFDLIDSILSASPDIQTAWVYNCHYTQRDVPNFTTSNNCALQFDGAICSIPAVHTCATPFVENQDKVCYKLMTLSKFFVDAEERCKKLGMSLATVPGEEHNNHIKSHISFGSSYMLGFKYQGGKWIYSLNGLDVDESAYNNFRDKQWPSANEGDIVVIGLGGTWRTENTAMVRKFICEYRVDALLVLDEKAGSSWKLFDEYRIGVEIQSGTHYHHEFTIPGNSIQALRTSYTQPEGAVPRILRQCVDFIV